MTETHSASSAIMHPPSPEAGSGLAQRIGLIAGLAMSGVLLLLPAPAGLDEAAWHTAAVAVLMAVWWMTEAIPIAATSLLPLAVFPLLGIAGIREAAAPYANPIIFLFLGGFLLAKGMERWGLHRRLALTVVARVGVRPRRIVLGFMLASAALSMGISNTATAVMMLPIALSVAELARRDNSGSDAEDRRFALVLMLAVAYACSIGGLGTLIGTPTNAFLAGFVETAYGVEISFAGWLVVGLPLVVIGLALAYGLLVRVVFPVRFPEIPGGQALIHERLRALGPVSRGEWTVGSVFGIVALCWITRPLLEKNISGLSDAGLAMIGAVALFALPVGKERALDWDTAKTLPWGILLLFGGGLSLAAAISETGLAVWIGEALAVFGTLPSLALVGIVVLVIVFLTELTSNTATAAAFLPVLAALAVSTGTAPLMLLVPATVAASCAFMLPVATPPNAIVYGSGYLTVGQMARAGLWLNIAFVLLLTVLAVIFVPLLTGTVLPDLSSIVP